MLVTAAKALCDDFAQGKPVGQLLQHFTEHEAVAIEHGDPSLAEWLGREYIGHKEIGEYFQTIADTLNCDNISYEELFVDEEELRVGLKGKARWTYKKTGKSWEETFINVLEYAEGESEGEDSHRELKVRKYSVWADTGAVSSGSPVTFNVVASAQAIGLTMREQ